MKKILLVFAVLMLTTTYSFTQKFAFVDTEYILNNIPSYKAAQEKLNQMSKEWEAEIKKMYDDVDKMYREYQAERVLLSDDMREKKEETIVNKEKEVKELQRKYFGSEGDLFKKRQELVKPIQEEVYNAVKQIATEGGYAVIFDSASGASILYTNPKHDKSDDVLRLLGYKN